MSGHTHFFLRASFRLHHHPATLLVYFWNTLYSYSTLSYYLKIKTYIGTKKLHIHLLHSCMSSPMSA
jgi:hypothetical protein